MIHAGEFKPAWWLRGAHAQTLWPNLLRIRPRLGLRRERLELPDGDFLDLDWAAERPGPLVIIFHGLEGSSRSPYAAWMLKALSEAGFQALLMHFRGCSGVPNRLARAYHAGETADMAHVVETLRERFPERPIAAVGYSLGGNALLKWLGQSAGDNPLSAAVAVSVPFDLFSAADRLERGLSRLYQWHLLGKLKASARRKLHLKDYPFTAKTLRAQHSFRAFDDHITAPLHGFADVEAYYREAGSRQYLKSIERATLILQARDDPFLYPRGLPEAAELSDRIHMELSEKGGHVGFVGGTVPGWGRYWLETRILTWLHAQLGTQT